MLREKALLLLLLLPFQRRRRRRSSAENNVKVARTVSPSFLSFPPLQERQQRLISESFSPALFSLSLPLSPSSEKWLSFRPSEQSKNRTNEKERAFHFSPENGLIFSLSLIFVFSPKVRPSFWLDPLSFIRPTSSRLQHRFYLPHAVFLSSAFPFPL